MASLYETADYLKYIEELIEAGEAMPEDMEDTIDAVNVDIDQKLNALSGFIKSLKNDSDGIAKAVKDMESRKQSKLKAAKRLTAYIGNCLKKLGRDSWENSYHKVSFRKSSALKITNTDKLYDYLFNAHPDFIAQSYSFDERAIKKAINEGESMDGAEIETRSNVQLK